MKIQFLIILFLVFISCKNVTKNETEQNQIAVDSIGFKNTTVEKQTENIESELEFEKISEVIQSIFEVENPELKEAFKPLEKEYYKLLDSTKVMSFKRYSDFLIIEFNNPIISKSEFNKIKKIAEKTLKSKNELYDYDGIFRKGGISFNLIDKWVIAHFLRCNMHPIDYEVDKNFTSKLENLNFKVDWVRSYCGWGKLEIK